MTDQLAADEVGEPTSLAPRTGLGQNEVTQDEGSAATARRFAGFRRSGRISRWDRPPEPHDWRFWVGNIGRVLIATGLLLFGFVAYQLWGTGIETARAQNDLENQFEAQLADADVAIGSLPGPEPAPDIGTAGPTAEPGADDTDSVNDTDNESDSANDNTETNSADDTDSESGAETEIDTDAAGNDATDDPAVRTEGASDLGSADISSGERADEGLPEVTDDDITVPVAVDLADVAVEQPPRRVVDGEVLARLEIPRIGRSDYVVPGVSLEALKKGPGHYPDTPLPGQLGNAAIAGHRTTHLGPFFDIDQLVAGDELVVTYTDGDRFVYEVTFVEVVGASDYYVVTTTNPDVAEMTLTSCHPKYTARDRIVVHSVLNPEKSSSVGLSSFYELEPEPDEQPIPGDDPVVSADDPVVSADEPALDASDIEITEPDSELGASPTTVADVENTFEEADDAEAPFETEDADDADPVAAGAGTERPDGDMTTATDDEPTPLDAFSQGWFDDRAAFGQIALWTLALAVISLFGYQIAKKFRRDSIGILVGIAPFLAALYFFYQNVNRLLPPGI